MSEHFTLGEFQSRDGADIVLIDDRLLAFLELLRRVLGGDLFRATVGVGSGYRSPAYNRAIGGASQSRHTKGDAADVVCKQDGKRIPGKLICALCAELGFSGVALNKGSGYSVHLDTYQGRTYRGDERKGYGNNVENGDFYAYFNITKAQVDALRIGERVEAPKEEEKPSKIKEDTEMVYKDITEVPEWGRESVQLRLDHGWSDCKNMTESLVRMWVSQDREDPYIVDFEDLEKHASWAVPEIEDLVRKGKIRGNTVEEIGKRLNVLIAVIIASRPEEVID